MSASQESPGAANVEELAHYWRLPSVRAARELARAVGVRKVGDRYPWHGIWAAEGLAPPPHYRWEELKLPHSTASDVAALLGESERSARRRALAKPDASFPDPVPLRKKPLLWRTAQLKAWQAGLSVPSYRKASLRGTSRDPEPLNVARREVSDAYDPWQEVRSAASAHG
ncbi:hypothetical protein [Alloyangia pacifica]|uniref:hypothetical protein n=1 Tax=Alloyangia pacifica TaxID=311180 RepID=UPI001CD51711|nr:hypothetical protein [Alloyangia pacifica]MCA0998777.1 hypothetical protein [Alloyangia pacifica]